MGLLVGLPITLLRLLLVLLRLALPVLLILLVIWLVQRRSRGSGKGQKSPSSPHFHGPVYTVDYKDVEDEQEGEDRGTS